MRSLIQYLRDLYPKSYCGILSREIIGFMYWKEDDSYFQENGLMEQERQKETKLGDSDGTGTRDQADSKGDSETVIFRLYFKVKTRLRLAVGLEVKNKRKR